MNLLRRNKTDRGINLGNGPATMRFRSEMDRVFDRFLQEPWGLSGEWFTPVTTWAPAMDVSETGAELTVRAEIPGVDSKDLTVSVDDNTLTIAGEKSEETEQKGEDFYHCERRFGSFKRTIELPGKVDENKVAAEYANGVLTVHVPKPETAKARLIDVKPTTGSKPAPARQIPVGARG